MQHPGFSLCGSSCCTAQALDSWASVVAAHGLSRGVGLGCSKACAIFPDQGSNRCPLHWQADSYPPCHQGSRGHFSIRLSVLSLTCSSSSLYILDISLSSDLSIAKLHPFPFPYCTHWKEVKMCGTHLRSKELCSRIFIGAEDLKLLGILSYAKLFFSPFVYLFIFYLY